MREARAVKNMCQDSINLFVINIPRDTQGQPIEGLDSL